jgi:hypothetical protein
LVFQEIINQVSVAEVGGFIPLRVRRSVVARTGKLTRALAIKMKNNINPILSITALFVFSNIYAETSLGLNYNFIYDNTNGLGISQIFYNKNKIDVINNCCIILLKNRNLNYKYEGIVDGFSIQSIVSYRVLELKKISLSPFLSYLVYGTVKFEKRFCLSGGLQTDLIKRLNLSIGILEPIQPHLEIIWDFYDPVFVLSVSIYLYKLKTTKWLISR